MRQRVHHHPCADCAAKTECPGEWEQNYDGVPDVICREYHLAGGYTDPDFLCDSCHALRADQDAADRAVS